MKKTLTIISLICLVVTCSQVIASAGEEKPQSKGIEAKMQSGKEYILMELDTGKVLIELFRDEAPGTVDNFIKLVNKGFYNGLAFHRVIEGFMAQGGCPKGDGTGGPGWTIKGEFTKNKKHVRGTVSMARTADPDSAGSQFFICFAPQPHLDGNYAIFGQVIEGMDAVDKIKKTGEAGGPTKIQKATYFDKRKKK